MTRTRSSRSEDLDAWRQFCDRLRHVGELITGDGFPSDPSDRAEGFRYLTRLTTMGLQRTFECQDPQHPAFLRHNDDITKWGGPNADNTYLRATVDGGGSYVITGTARNPGGFILQTSTGGMESSTLEIFDERSDQSFSLEPGEEFRIVLCAQPTPGNWMSLHPRATTVLIREYFADWEADRSCGFRIDRIDSDGASPRLTPQDVASKLTTAAEWIEQSLVFWNSFWRDRVPLPNQISTAPMGVVGGAEGIVYGSGRWELSGDQALVVEFDAPDSRYWSLQLYSLGWYESLDCSDRQTSLNDRQATVDRDGRVRVLIAHRDPGVQNWLDTEGRPEGIVHFRAVGSPTRPLLHCRVVPYGEVRSHLPPETTGISAEQRRAAISQRRRGVAMRFRQ